MPSTNRSESAIPSWQWRTIVICHLTVSVPVHDLLLNGPYRERHDILFEGYHLSEKKLREERLGENPLCALVQEPDRRENPRVRERLARGSRLLS